MSRMRQNLCSFCLNSQRRHDEEPSSFETTVHTYNWSPSRQADADKLEGRHRHCGIVSCRPTREISYSQPPQGKLSDGSVPSSRRYLRMRLGRVTLILQRPREHLHKFLHETGQETNSDLALAHSLASRLLRRDSTAFHSLVQDDK